MPFHIDESQGFLQNKIFNFKHPIPIVTAIYSGDAQGSDHGC